VRNLNDAFKRPWTRIRSQNKHRRWSVFQYGSKLRDLRAMISLVKDKDMQVFSIVEVAFEKK